MSLDTWTLFLDGYLPNGVEGCREFFDEFKLSTSQQETALKIAVGENKPDVVAFLLERGIDPDYRGVLYRAISDNSVDVARALVGYGATFDEPREVLSSLESSPDEPMTAYEYAELLGRSEILELFDSPEDIEIDHPSPFKAGRHKGFHDTTYAVVVAGRQVIGLELVQARSLSTTCEKWSKELDRTIVAVPAGDFVERLMPFDTTNTPILVGVEAASVKANRGGPGLVSRDDMTAALEQACKLPAAFWEDVAKAAGVDHDEMLGDEVTLRVAGSGPLALAGLYFGMFADPDADVPEGLALGVGQDANQNRHYEGVLGVEVATASFDGRETVEVDIGDDVHQQRVGAVAELQGVPSYQLFAQYD